MKILLSVLLVSFATGTLFAKNCTTPEVKGVCPDKLIVEKAEWACKLIEEKGWDALPAIKTERFDCCDMPNYIWVNEFKDKEVKMILHPTSPVLNNKDVTDIKDPDGRFIIQSFIKALKEKPEGAWSEYKWTKMGDTRATNKKSYVKKCKVKGQDYYWVTASGTWTE